jgi:hypothetical protein
VSSVAARPARCWPPAMLPSRGVLSVQQPLNYIIRKSGPSLLVPAAAPFLAFSFMRVPSDPVLMPSFLGGSAKQLPRFRTLLSSGDQFGPFSAGHERPETRWRCLTANSRVMSRDP